MVLHHEQSKSTKNLVNMKQNFMFFAIFCLTAVLFAFAFVRQIGQEAALHLQWSKPFTYLNGSWSDTQQQPSFEQVARKYGTDKVTEHSYQSMYEKYLPPLRTLPVKILEIGLGCNMGYGPGASYYTWLEYFPRVELYFIEFDALCALKYQDKTINAHVFVGDQADVAFLERFAAETTSDGLFDLVVDDGGHTMEQQITSLEHLWPIIKAGGLYVIEDLQTSYMTDYGGDPSIEDSAKHTTMGYLQRILNDLMTRRHTGFVSRDLLSVDCMAEICALQKKRNGDVKLVEFK